MTRFLITGALPYSNGPLHVGHIAGAYLPADIYARYLRARGHEVRFICGSDDNGVAALNSARKENRPVEDLTADYRSRQHQAFAGLGIHFDIYSGTHSFEAANPNDPASDKVYQRHEAFAQRFFLDIYKNGYFSKQVSAQLFDPKVQQFLPDRYVIGTCPKCGDTEANAGQCEKCSNLIEQTELLNPRSVLSDATPELRETVHWWLNLHELAPALDRWLASQAIRGQQEPTDGQLAWRPLAVNMARGFVDSLKPRAMTRDLSWGVPVPLEDPEAAGKSLYVWFDAPIGYVTFTAIKALQDGADPETYKDWWHNPDCRIVHFIGEDNIVFHAVTWPAMLLATRGNAAHVDSLDPNKLDASGFQLPRCVVANAYLNFILPSGEEVKQSKSKGTAVFIDRALEVLDPDPLRYYLTAIAPEGAKAAFSWDDFFARNNNELVAAFGNFVNRYQKVLEKDFQRIVPALPAAAAAETRSFLSALPSARDEVASLIEGFDFKLALQRAMQLARDCNAYIDLREPWNRMNPKKELPGKPVGEVDRPHVAETLSACLTATRTLGTIFAPFLPFTAESIRAMLALELPEWTWDKSCEALPEGHKLGAATMLFKKLDPATTFES